MVSKKVGVEKNIIYSSFIAKYNLIGIKKQPVCGEKMGYP